MARVDPNQAIRNGKGQVESVHYNAMLLNEFLKGHNKIEEQKPKLAHRSAQGAGRPDSKGSVQPEVSKDAPQTVANK